MRAVLHDAVIVELENTIARCRDKYIKYIEITNEQLSTIIQNSSKSEVIFNTSLGMYKYKGYPLKVVACR